MKVRVDRLASHEEWEVRALRVPAWDVLHARTKLIVVDLQVRVDPPEVLELIEKV
jgi:hypothetical protein